MKNTADPKTKYILLGLLVTFLWATSWVLVKWGLEDIPPVIFAGLRYFIAFLALLPFVLNKKQLEKIAKLGKRDWVNLILLGTLYYAITQGAQFAGLAVLPAMTVSLILSFTSIFVAAFGIIWLGEKPTWLQWLGLGLNLLGAYLYFFPVEIPRQQLIALLIVFIGMIGNSVSMIISRKVNREAILPPVTITTISMGIGAILLLAAGLGLEGVPHISGKNWLFILWMSLINTALAFTLWNKVLQVLEAMEASIINNTIMVQIAVLAWLVLGEGLTGMDVVGVALAVLGAILVQIKPGDKAD